MWMSDYLVFGRNKCLSSYWDLYCFELWTLLSLESLSRDKTLLTFLLKEIHVRILEFLFFRRRLTQTSPFALHMISRSGGTLFHTRLFSQCREHWELVVCRNVSANRAINWLQSCSAIVTAKITCFIFCFCSFKSIHQSSTSDSAGHPSCSIYQMLTMLQNRNTETNVL